ncbi:MAG: hypothetical protein M9941_06485 [Anaerolineae bacterium]|nr:hypothetical protein [Anaerolineae bacterium]MCO5197383.1 hypothetical protein [Anaerolineae bacterium]
MHTEVNSQHKLPIWSIVIGLLLMLGITTTLVFAVADGNLDPTFDGDGIAVTEVSGLDNEAHAIATQQDLKTVVVGLVTNGDGTTDLLLIRYRENGTLDTTFGSGGKVISTLMDAGNGIAIRQDGKIVVAGYKQVGANTQFAVARFNSNGSPDTSFGTNGVTLTPVGSGDAVAHGIYLQLDEQIVVAGSSENASQDMAIIRYSADGVLDSTFGTGGIVQVDFPLGLADVANGVVVQLDGKIVAAGATRTDRPREDEDFALVRLNTNGTLDTSFGSAGTGLVQTPISKPNPTDNRNDGAFAVTIQSDGKIVAAGYSEINQWTVMVAVVRYLENGTLDTEDYGGFANQADGYVQYNTGDNKSIARGVSIQTDGKSVVFTTAEASTSASINVGFIVMRLELNGMFDFGFKNGYLVVDLPDAERESAYGVALQRDGKIVVTGLSEFSGETRTTTMRVISGAPLMAVDPSILNYVILPNDNRIQSKSFSISGYNETSSADELRWSVVSTEEWLTINEANGVGDVTLQATVDATGMENGIYSAKIVVFAGSATRQEVEVILEIADEALTYAPLVLSN